MYFFASLDGSVLILLKATSNYLKCQAQFNKRANYNFPTCGLKFDILLIWG